MAIKIFGGLLRPTKTSDGGAYWHIINDSDHRPEGLASVIPNHYSQNRLALIFASSHYGNPHVGTIVAGVDDGFLRKKITVGTPLGQTNSNILIYHNGIEIDPARIFDYIADDGDGNITIIGFNHDS